MAAVPSATAHDEPEAESLPLLNTASKEAQHVSKWRRATMIGASTVALLAVLIAVTCIFTRGTVHADPLPADGTLFTFLVVGDWGRANNNQRKCMQRMNTVAEGWKPELVISTGDNFYPDGLSAVDDPKMAAAFTTMYSHSSLQVPWYAVLGNHDYGDGWKNDIMHNTCGDTCRSPQWQYTKLQQPRDARWNCQNGTYLMNLHNNTVAVLFIDTPPMIKRYATRPWANYKGGYMDQDVAAQLEDIQKHLKSDEFRSATWRIVVGHHAVRSYGEHCTGSADDCTAMSFLLQWLEDARVHLYLNGHDHDQQHIKFPNETTHYVTTGAGSDCRIGEFVGVDTQHAQFLSDLQGFVAVAVAEDKLTASFFVYNSEYPAHQLQLLANQTH